MAIKIEFLAGIFPFLKGTKDMSKALDDVSDSLDDVARDAARAADRAGDDLGDEISDGAKDAEKGVERLERTFKDMADTARKESRDAGDSMRRNVRDGSDRAGDAVKEFGDEAKQNISETFSSFRGEAEDFAQIVQDTLGGLVSNLGPAGMIGAAFGALTLGGILAETEQAKERTEEMRQKVAELAEEMIDAEGVGTVSIDNIADRMRAMAIATDEGSTSLSQLQKDSKRSVTSFEDLAEAMAGNVDGLDEMIAKEREVLDELEDYNRFKGESQKEQAAAQRRIVEGLEDTRIAVQEAADAEAAAAKAGYPEMLAKADAIDALQGELDEAIGSWGDYYDAETGALDPAGYIAAMQARMDATSNFNTNVQTLAKQFGLSFEETQYILDQGVDFAPMLQSIIDSGLGDEFAAQVQAAVGGGQEIINGTPLGATVSVAADTGTAQQQLEETAAGRETTVEAIPEVSRAQRALDEVATKNRTATITAVAQTTDARYALDRLVEEKTVVIRARVLDQRGVPVP